MKDSKARNHYVPQFLLKRFASRTKGKTRWVWQFSKERPPIEIGTRDAGVSEFFYGRPENGVEDRLGQVEKIQSQALDEIDNGQSPSVHAQTLRHLIWMLSVRTRALRKQFVSVGTNLIDHLEDTAGSSDANDAFVAQADRDFDQVFDKAMADGLAKLPAAYRERAIFLLQHPDRRAVFRKLLLEHVGQLDIQGFIGWMRREAGDRLDLDKPAASGQIRGLSSILDRADAPPAFAPTDWLVITRPPGTFVLGDGCVFATDNDGRVASLFALGKDWRAVYLPISDRSVLVGAPSAIEQTLPDDGINLASVELGSDVFFSSRSSEREAAFVHRIGMGVPLIGDDEMARIARNSWQDMKEGKSRPKADSE